MSIRLTIDGCEVEAPDGATLLQAAAQIGVEIPTLCHRDGRPHYTSCMVCAVLDRRGGRLLPACAYPAADGMDIDTRSDAVRQARRDVLALLLSEHVGDCEAPCRRACPARFRIPEMLRDGGAAAWDRAAQLAAEDLVLPGTLGWICPAPCEKSCRRGRHDRPLAIRDLHRRLGETRVAEAVPLTMPPLRGLRAAVIGAGPAGLSAAVWLRRGGVGVTLYEAAPQAGGAMRNEIPDERLPRDLLEAEIARLLGDGIELRVGERVDAAAKFARIRADADVVVLACGRQPLEVLHAWGLRATARGVEVDATSRQTNLVGVFAAGDIVQSSRMAVRSVADGRLAAAGALRALSIPGANEWVARFDSRIGPLEPSEIAQFLPDAGPDAGAFPGDDRSRRLDARAAAEAARCLGCDCRKAASCRLRRYADEYGADAGQFRAANRWPVSIRRDHSAVVFEPGKCIRCGLCVRITAGLTGVAGMTFQQRGYDETVVPSFAEGLEAGLGPYAKACVDACPTAALSFRCWERIDPSRR